MLNHTSCNLAINVNIISSKVQLTWLMRFNLSNDINFPPKYEVLSYSLFIVLCYVIRISMLMNV